MKRVFLFFIVIFFIVIFYYFSKSKTIQLKGSQTNIVLEYNCDSFIPQAESKEDLLILSENAVKLAKVLQEKERFVTLSSLHSALRTQNFREVEKIIVDELCKIESEK